MQITRPEEIKAGQWYCICCVLDLSQVADEDEANDIAETMRNEIEYPDEAIGLRVWDTKESALLELEKEE